jgi:hypothetical protein
MLPGSDLCLFVLHWIHCCCPSHTFDGRQTLMSAPKGRGFSFATIQAALEGVEMNNVDRQCATQQCRGAAIPFGHGPAEGRHPRLKADLAPKAQRDNG